MLDSEADLSQVLVTLMIHAAHPRIDAEIGSSESLNLKQREQTNQTEQTFLGGTALPLARVLVPGVAQPHKGRNQFEVHSEQGSGGGSR